MPTGIQTYHLELHAIEPIDWWSDMEDYTESEIREIIESHNKREKQKILVEHKGYTMEVYRNSYTDIKNKTYIQSWIEITKNELKLKDTHRFEPDEYHPDGMILTELPLMVTSTKDPVSAEWKLLDKARLIIDRLNKKGKAILTMCNRGNILELEVAG